MSGAMNGKSSSQAKSTTPSPTFSLSHPGILQRKCDCGGVPGLTGQCEECNSKRLSGQRGMTPPALPNNPPDDQATAQKQRLPLGGYSFGNLAIEPQERFGIQTKLAIGQPRDKYEQEADRVADQVMRMPAPDSLARVPLTNPNLPLASHHSPLQRQEVKEEEEEKKKRKIQAKEEPGQTPKVTPELEERLQASQGKGQPLPEETRSFMESRFGHDFSQVQIHVGTDAEQMNRQLNAQAFTHRQNVFFGDGKYSPGSSEGKRLLAHELTHVLQQKNIGNPLVQRNNGDVLTKQPTSEAIATSVGKVTLEQYPAEGRAILRYQGWAWAQYLWEASPGRNLPVVSLEQSEGLDMQLSIKIEAPFRVDVTVAESVEQGIAIDVGRRVQVRHRYNFQGGVTTKLRDGSIEREAAPVEIAYEYSPRFMLEAPSPPRKKLPPLAPPSEQPPQPVPKSVHKTWSFDTVEKYKAFALAHKDTKWAEILTKDGKHVAFALTVEAVTRMAERLRQSDYNFEFLSEFPGGKVVSVHLYGKKLPSIDALADLYFRNSDAALVGPPNATPECEVFQMEQKRFGRKALSHQEALARWGEIEKLPPDSFNTLKTDGEYTFFALRVRGASGLQTISATDLPTVREELTKKSEFAPTSPIGDDLSLPLPANLAYGDIVSALQTLYRRKLNITEGREGTEELDAINSRIQMLVGKLHELGIRRSDTEIFDAIQKGVALNKITGRLVVSPERDKYFFGERLTVRIVLDYLPPGSTVEVAWRWSAKGNENLFFSEGKRSKSLELIPDDLFWNVAESNDIGRAMGFEVKAYLYVDGGKTATLPLSTTWIPLEKGLPPSLTIGGPKTIVQGAWAEFRIAEWAPIRSHYSLDWFINQTRVVEDLPALRRKFDTTGTYKVTAKIYRVRRSFGIQDKTLATEASTDFEVQDMEVAGSKFLEQTAAQKLPSLSQVGRTMATSIQELEKREAQGGTAASYWKMRLEAQKKRQESLEWRAPGYESFQDLPAEPTTVAGQDTYSRAIPAALVLPEGGVQPLQMYLTIKKEGDQYQARLLDITGADVWKFDGSGSTPLDAYTKAFETWKGDHPYPRGGKVVYSFSPQVWTLGKSFETTRIGNTVKAWVDGLLTVGALVVTALLLAAPDATITKVLGLMMLAATVARSTVAIVENVSLGIAPLDSRNILEAASILTSFMGVGGTALRQVGIRSVRPIAYRAGSWLVLATVTADVTTLIYTTSTAIEQMRAVQADPTKDEGQKSLEMLRLAATLMMQGTMFIVANKDMVKGASGLRRSDFFATDPKATLPEGKWVAAGEVKLEPGARLDVAAELRKAGDDIARITKIPDAELLTRYSMMPWLSATLSEAEVAALLKRASTNALTGLSELSAKEAKHLFERIGNDVIANDLAPLLHGSGLDALVTATGPKKLADLHGTFGAEGTAKLAGELGTDRVGHLVNGKEAITAAELKDLSEKLGNNVLKNLAYTAGTDLSGKDILALVKAHGDNAVKWAGKDLRGNEVKELLAALSKDAVKGLQDISANRARTLVKEIGPDLVNAVAPAIGGSRLATLRELLGAETTANVMGQKVKKNKVADLVAYADNLEAARKTALATQTPLGASSLILDTNTFQAIKELLAGAPWKDLKDNKKAMINSLRSRAGLPPLTGDPSARDLASIIGVHDLRAANIVLAESAPAPGLTRSGVPITISRDDAAYKGVLAELSKTPAVGSNKGAADRAAIADAAFAKTADGKPSTFVTGDIDVFVRLAEKYAPKGTIKTQKRPNGSMETKQEAIVRDRGKNGFLVTIPDGTGGFREIRIVPVL